MLLEKCMPLGKLSACELLLLMLKELAGENLYGEILYAFTVEEKCRRVKIIILTNLQREQNNVRNKILKQMYALDYYEYSGKKKKSH